MLTGLASGASRLSRKRARLLTLSGESHEAVSVLFSTSVPAPKDQDHEVQRGIVLLGGGHRSITVSQSSAETVQTAANVFDGRPFLYVEGESASTFNAPVDGITWKIATKGGPDMSVVIGGNVSSHCANDVQCLWIRYLGASK